MKLRLSLLTLVALLICAVPVGASPHAHALPVRSSPEPNATLDVSPAKVEIFFTEALEPSFSSIRVLDTNGVQVDNGDSLLDSTDPTRLVVTVRALSDGVYTVAWKALSAVDGHVTSGAFPFAVGNVDAAALAAADQTSRQIKLSLGEVLARWLTYLAVAALTGGALFQLVVWRPAYRLIKKDFGLALLDPTRWRRLAACAAIGLMLGNILALLVQAGQAAGTEIAAPWNTATGNILFTTRYGAVWLARFTLSLVLGVVAARARRPREHWFALGAALLLLLTLSVGSHAAAEAQPLWPVLNDWLHLSAASAWLGGLLSFGAGLWATRNLDSAPRTRLTATLLPRFSALALTSVGALALSGLYAAVLRVGSFAALVNTLYGQTLLNKTFLALVMMGFGAVNLLFVTPRLRHATTNAPLVARFLGFVTIEMILGAALLLSVALLTSLPPARVASPTGLTASARADDLLLRLVIAPGRVGINTFTLSVRANGQPVTGAKEVALRFTLVNGTLPPSDATLVEDQPGEYSLKGAYFSLSGQWQVQAVVRRADKFDAFANFNFALGTETGASAVVWTRLTGVLLLLAAFAHLIGTRALARTRVQLVAFAVAPALALFIVGTVVFNQPPVNRAGLVNPIAPNADSIAQGQTHFEAHCVPCHGETGKGDGPIGLTLNPRPADLTLHAVPGVHSDGQLYEWISNGYPNSVMPAFSQTLSNTDRWNLVNYIRTLAPKGK